jgi:hypothetical protein
MEGSTAVAPPPQRVCPECARISWATGPRCPYCTSRFRSGRGIRPWQLWLAVGLTLLGVLVMFFIAGNILENRVNDRIEEINKDFDASLNRFQADVRKELDARLPAAGTGAAPTATPTPFATETPSPTTTPDAGTSPTATPTATATTTAEATPTESPHTEIRP